MKLRLIVGLALAFLLALALSANFIVQAYVSERLPAVLQGIEGRPVSLTNVRTNIWRLQASADRFSYGAPGAEAIIATNVLIHLEIDRLIRGEIYLGAASADSLLINPASWLAPVEANEAPAASDQPDEQEMAAAEFQRWMPDRLQLGQLELFLDGTRVFVGEQLRWTGTRSDQQRVLWSDTWGREVYSYELRLDSAFNIATNKAADAVLTVSSQGDGLLLTGNADVNLMDDRYDTKITFDGPSLKGVWQIQADNLFDLGTGSKLDISHLEPTELEHVAAIFDFSVERDQAVESRDVLKAPLPDWQLPDHRVDTTINEIKLGDEVIRDLVASIQFTPGTAPAGGSITVSDLRARLPRSDLKGSMSATLGESWTVAVDAQANTENRAQAVPSEFLGSDWQWQVGQVKLRSQGSTLAALLNNAHGAVDLQGVYAAADELPVTLTAKLDERGGRLGSDDIELQIGDSMIAGTAWFDEGQQNLFLRLDAKLFDLTQLLSQPAAEQSPVAPGEPGGFEIPDLGWWQSTMKIDAKLVSQEFRLPGMIAKQVDLEFLRAMEGDRLHLALAPGGTGHVELTAITKRQAEQRDLTLDIAVSGIDPATVGINTSAARLGGSLRVRGSGDRFRELVGDLAGPVEFRFKGEGGDSDIHLKAQTRLLIKDEHIVGLNLDALALNVADAPVAGGRLSLDATIPKISGSLRSVLFDVDELLSLLPRAAEKQDAGLVAALRGLPEFDLALQADRLKLKNQVLSEFAVKLGSNDGERTIDDLRFSSKFGNVQARGNVRLQGERIDLVLNSDLGGVELNQLLESRQIPKLAGPLVGTLTLQTSGKDWQDLLAKLTGQFSLHDPAHKTDADERLNVDVVVRQSPEGAAAEIRSLQWGRSDLRGQVTFKPGQPPRVTADIESDFLDLDFIQEKLAGTDGAIEFVDGKVTKGPPASADGGEQESTGQEGTAAAADAAGAGEDGVQMGQETAPSEHNGLASVGDFGRSSMRLLRGVLATPFNLFIRGTDTNSKHFFAQEPYQVEVLKALDADIKLRLGRGSGSSAGVRELAVDASLEGGNFNILVSAGEVNSAPLNLAFGFDGRQTPPLATLNSTVSGYYPGADKSRAPRSVYVDLRAEGNSQAELMGSMNGEMYLEVGRGVTDIVVIGTGFFTGDLLNRVGGMLVPKKSGGLPTVECGIGYSVINEGILRAPYGMVVQFPDANILIATTINMKKETIAAEFDSRSRTGAGVSVGNVFSNTVRLSGPLVNPGLVPNATGLAWRSWAALMTGGLSLIGESVAKRILASRDPCKDLSVQIQEKVCKPGITPAASSPLVCGAG